LRANELDEAVAVTGPQRSACSTMKSSVPCGAPCAT
jgi:hypothetical protein